MKYLFPLVTALVLMGAGCLPPARQTAIDTNEDECSVSIDISSAPGNTSEYDTATFTYPCDWENQSTATVMELNVPGTNAGLIYPSSFEGDLQMDGVDKPITIMGQEHMRYIAQDPEDAMGPVTRELIRGPVTDTLGVRPYYQYPVGSPVGAELAAVFASIKLE